MGAKMDTVQYFGYGSLVNRDTRPASEPFSPATVDGWRRAWAHPVDNVRAASVSEWSENDHIPLGYTVLTVEQAEGVQIDGVQVSISASDLPALDARERGYSRCSVASTKSTDPVAIYVSNSAHADRACSDYPLLQSYVDCVLAGFLAVFGWDGVDRFIATTQGWSAPVLADRQAPLYPRAVMLSDELLAAFDERIAAAQRF